MTSHCEGGWGQVQGDEELGPLSIDYYYLYYCFLSPSPSSSILLHSFHSVIILLFILLWIIWLIHLLSQTSANYFSPTLSTICKQLHLNHDLAGVTLLALGNGAPDIFTILASFKKSVEDPAVGMGEIIGASLFSSTIVIGSIAILCPCDLMGFLFIRDCGFHLLAVLVISFFGLVFHEISLIGSCVLFVLYVMYIVIVLYSSNYLDCSSCSYALIVDQENSSGSNVPIQRIESAEIDEARHDHDHGHEEENLTFLDHPHVRQQRTTSDIHYDRNSDMKDHDHYYHHDHDHYHHSNSFENQPIDKFPSYDHELVLKLIISDEEQEEYNVDHDHRHQQHFGVNGRDELHPLSVSNLSQWHSHQYGTFNPTKNSRNSSESTGSGKPHSNQHLRHSRPQHICNHPAHFPTSPLVQETPPKPEEPCIVCEQGNADHDHLHQHQLAAAAEAKAASGSVDCFTIIYHYSATLLESLDWRKFALQRRFHHQIILKEWKTYSKLYQFYYIGCEFPITFLRDITIPCIEEVQEESEGIAGERMPAGTEAVSGWNQIYAILHPFTDCFLILYICTKFDFIDDENQFDFLPCSPLFFCAIVGGTVSILIALTTNRLTPPTSILFHVYTSTMAFIMCIIWVYIFAEELVTCLTALGQILHIPSAFLGITLLAWGNGMGDYCTNLAIAKQGYGAMAIVGSNAGPIFNLLIGFGISLFYTAARQYPRPYYFHLNDPSLMISLSSLIGILVFSLVLVSMRGFQFDSVVGILLIGSYLVYSTVQLIYVLFTIHQPN